MKTIISNLLIKKFFDQVPSQVKVHLLLPAILLLFWVFQLEAMIDFIREMHAPVSRVVEFLMMMISSVESHLSFYLISGFFVIWLDAEICHFLLTAKGKIKIQHWHNLVLSLQLFFLILLGISVIAAYAMVFQLGGFPP